MKNLQIGTFEKKEGFTTSHNGIVICRDEKPEYSSIMLTEKVPVMTGGFINIKTKVGFVTGSTKDINTLVESFNLKPGMNYNSAIGPHKIITIEKKASDMTESDKGFRAKINPETGEELTSNGDAVFRRTFVVAEGSDMVDTYVSHDKSNVVVETPATTIKEDLPVM